MKNTWWFAWIMQALAMCVLSALTVAAQLFGGLFSTVLLWVVFPLGSMVSAYKVTLHGLNNYLAWIIPPVALTVVYTLVYAYTPHFAAVLVCAFLSIVGAAAGEVRNREK